MKGAADGDPQQPVPPAQQVAAPKTDANTVDVETKTRS
jgi:hypothetical protein